MLDLQEFAVRKGDIHWRDQLPLLDVVEAKAVQIDAVADVRRELPHLQQHSHVALAVDLGGLLDLLWCFSSTLSWLRWIQVLRCCQIWLTRSPRPRSRGIDLAQLLSLALYFNPLRILFLLLGFHELFQVLVEVFFDAADLLSAIYIFNPLCAANYRREG
jgi:hypothetical protein